MTMIHGLDHVTINTSNLAATEAFYTEVVGLELAPRPNTSVPGIWLKFPGEAGLTVLHVLEVGAVSSHRGKAQPFDHVAFHAQGYDKALAKIEETGIAWCGNIISDFGLWQLMFYDPNGIKVELNFKAVNEIIDEPVIPEGHEMQLEDFFEPEAYEGFGG